MEGLIHGGAYFSEFYGMFSKFTHVMKPTCDTNSEPGLPVVLTHMFQCVFVAISPLTLLYQGHSAPWNFTLTRPLLWPM